MNRKGFIVNPFRMLSKDVDAEVLRLKELHLRRVSESSTLHEGLLIMISKLIEITRLLSECIVTHNKPQMDQCAAMIKQLDEEEKILTRHLLTSGLSGDMWKGVIRFPYRLKRIGDMLDSILRCTRIKAEAGVPFSDVAGEELGQIFSMLLKTMTDLREAFNNPTLDLLRTVEAQCATLRQLVDDFRQAHWERLQLGICVPDASSMYRDILDSVKLTGEYLEKMSVWLLEIGEGQAE